MAILDGAKERYFHRTLADQEFTTLNVPKLVNDIGVRINRLIAVRERLDEVVNGTLSAEEQLARVEQGLSILTIQLDRLTMMYRLLEYSMGPEET